MGPNRDKLVAKELTAVEGLPVPLLRKKLHDAVTIADGTALDLAEGHLDSSTIDALRRIFDTLALQAVIAQACIVASIFALESKHVELPGAFPSSSWKQPPSPSAAPYLALRGDAMECLEKLGTLFESLAPSFQEHAYPSCASKPKSWNSHPVDVGFQAAPRTGKGYLNSFQDDRVVEPAARRDAFEQRLAHFLASGGSRSDMI